MTRIMPMTVTSKLIIINTCWAALVVWAAINGYVGFVFGHDVSHISYVIAALFLFGLVHAFRGGETLADIIEWLVTLGLISNVVGFVIALHGVDGADVTTAEGAQKIAQQLLSGMGVAFFGTLVGAVTALWLSTNKRVLSNG